LNAEFCGVPRASRVSESETRFKNIRMRSSRVSWLRLHATVGKLDGDGDGAVEGPTVGLMLGRVVGIRVGVSVGFFVGVFVGRVVTV
jgi:hypothetical protein